MPGVVNLTAYKYVQGTKVPCAYVATNIGDGYLYFNDNEYYRVYTEEPFKNQVEILYPSEERWVITDNIIINQGRELDGKNVFRSSVGGTVVPAGAGVENAVRWAIEIANDKSHGYDQGSRNGQFGDYDCSSLVYNAFYHGGSFPLPLMPNSPGTTYSMIADFTSMDGWEWIPGIANDSSNLQRGDILLFEGDINAHTGHTAIYTGGGMLVEASINEFGGTTGGVPGDQTGCEIYEHGFYAFPWDGVLRYKSKAVTSIDGSFRPPTSDSTLNFIDISSWQGDAGLNLSDVASSLDGVIIKATENTNYTNPYLETFINQAIANNLKWGFYHYAKNSDPVAEADYFVNVCEDYFTYGIPCLDWEEGQTVDWVNSFVDRVYQRTGIWCWIYSWPRSFDSETVNENCGRWVCTWPNIVANPDFSYDEGDAPTCDGVVCAWQFASDGRLPGYSGNLDMNRFYGSRTDWDTYAQGTY